ncbi:MAG: NAD(P)H-binding protein [Actinobacteria bacterium]|nr:NAD(P)H-binding protein [Actinomycetota bacterium]
MARIVLFGATGYTGRLTAHALFEHGADFAIAGRNRSKLEELADATGHPDVRVAAIGDVDALIAALDGASVLITCVGPFVELGQTAVEAALAAGTHYIDIAGEGVFVARLIAEKDAAAKERGIVMAPCMGFDEVPGDVAVALATEGMRQAEVDLTYAVPTTPSVGTIKSSLGVVLAPGSRIVDGHPESVNAAQRSRWAPMPPPIGPRQSISVPLAIAHLAPMHVDLKRFETFFTVGRIQKALARPGLGALRAALKVPGASALADKAISLLPAGPGEEARTARWTILAEAADDSGWRNVVVQGRDGYGLTAQTLTAGAMALADRAGGATGVLPPVEAIGLDVLQKTLTDQDVQIDVYGPTDDPRGE